MMSALESARLAVENPLSESEQDDGWNQEQLVYVRRWLDDCESHLLQSPHPASRMYRSWVRGWDGVPGKAFDPRIFNERRDAILKASNALTWVLDFEKLWTMVTELQHRLETEQHSLDVTDKVATGVSDALGVLRVRLRTDTPITSEEMDLWQNLLSPYGAKWTDRYGNPWVPGGREGRFWLDQPGPLWSALAPIVRLGSEIDWQYSIEHSNGDL